MRSIAIIPARMASTRFPGKPIVPILGLPMIEHVRRRVLMSETVSDVIVATCDQEIKEVVESSGGKVIMTKDTHERATDRVAEAAQKFKADVIVTIQGDEPLILPRMVDEVTEPFKDDEELPSSNLVIAIEDDEEFTNPNAPKVVVNRSNDLLYISREPIPSGKKFTTGNYRKIKQLGIIAFRSQFLQNFTNLEPTPLEIIESVDMNRAVEHGYKVKIVETKGKMIGVDIPEDVSKVEEILKSDPLVKNYM